MNVNNQCSHLIIFTSLSLLYCNHSCNPSVRFQVSCPRDQWRAEALRDIKAGDVLEFFYPSTEWNMSQPFDCSCGSKVISSCWRDALTPDWLHDLPLLNDVDLLEANFGCKAYSIKNIEDFCRQWAYQKIKSSAWWCPLKGAFIVVLKSNVSV